LAIEEQTTWMDDASWDNWRSPMFQFARFCKAHPDLSDRSDHEAMRKVEKAMRKFDDLPRGANPWEFYFPYADADDPDSARLDFMASWVSIRHVPFSDVLSNAMRLAKGEPLRPKCDRGELYARFVSFAAWLQFLMGDSDIWLPTRKFAEFLSCDQRTVSRLRKLAIRDGLLTIVKPHCFRSSGRSEATSFRFAIERFPDLCERQERYLRFPPRNM
jgi:hypothetical protein